MRLCQAWIDMAKATEGSDLEKKCDQYESILNESVLTDAKSKAEKEMYQLEAEQKLAKKAGKIQILKQKIEESKVKIEKASKNLKTKNLEIQNSVLKNEIKAKEDIKKKIKEVTSKSIQTIAEYDKNNNISKSAEEVFTANKNLEDAKRKLELENKQLKKENKELRQKIQNKTYIPREDLEKQAADGFQKDNKIKENKKAIKDLNNKIKKLETDNKDLIAKVGEMSKSLEEKLNEITQLDILLKKKQDTIKILEKENQDLKKNLEVKDIEIKRLKEDLEREKEKNTEMRSKLDHIIGAQETQLRDDEYIAVDRLEVENSSSVNSQDEQINENDLLIKKDLTFHGQMAMVNIVNELAKQNNYSLADEVVKEVQSDDSAQVESKKAIIKNSYQEESGLR